jgi:hypothetical protein
VRSSQRSAEKRGEEEPKSTDKSVCATLRREKKGEEKNLPQRWQSRRPDRVGVNAGN